MFLMIRRPPRSTLCPYATLFRSLLMYGSSLITMNCAPALGLDLEPGQSDQAMPALAQRLVELKAAPALLAGLLIAAPFAAVMSTVDSALLVISACVVRDLVEKSFGVRLSDVAVRRLSYSVTALAGAGVCVGALMIEPRLDRKSTRLNSSHKPISYAVFCLKKKK